MTMVHALSGTYVSHDMVDRLSPVATGHHMYTCITGSGSEKLYDLTDLGQHSTSSDPNIIGLQNLAKCSHLSPPVPSASASPLYGNALM